MPPSPDKNLEERILKAAQRLWRVRGPRGLTLRAVAQEAGTTTPTVYKRFGNKQALQIALALRFRQQLNEELFSAATLEEIPARYVGFAEQHPNEYQMLWSTWTDIFHPELPRPGRSWFVAQLAALRRQAGGLFPRILCLFPVGPRCRHSSGRPRRCTGPRRGTPQFPLHMRLVSPEY